MKFVKKYLMYVFKHLGRVFFAGLIIWAVPVLIIFVARFILGDIESVIHGILVTFIPDKFIYPGFGILLVIILFYFTGLILIKTNLFAKIPGLGAVFGSKKGKMLLPQDLLKLTPCLFLKSTTCISPGWILSKEPVKISGEEEPLCELVNVYYPNTPGLVTGQIYPLKKETVIKIANSSREIIDFLLYTIRIPENIICLPWEDETQKELEERVKRFGINLE